MFSESVTFKFQLWNQRFLSRNPTPGILPGNPVFSRNLDKNFENPGFVAGSSRLSRKSNAGYAKKLTHSLIKMSLKSGTTRVLQSETLLIEDKQSFQISLSLA